MTALDCLVMRPLTARRKRPKISRTEMLAALHARALFGDTGAYAVRTPGEGADMPLSRRAQRVSVGVLLFILATMCDLIAAMISAFDTTTTNNNNNNNNNTAAAPSPSSPNAITATGAAAAVFSVSALLCFFLEGCLDTFRATRTRSAGGAWTCSVTSKSELMHALMFVAAALFSGVAFAAGPTPSSGGLVWAWLAALTYLLDSALYFLPIGGRSRVCCQSKCDGQPVVQKPLLVATSLYLAGSSLDVLLGLVAPKGSPFATVLSAVIWLTCGLGYAYDEMYNEAYGSDRDEGIEFASFEDNCEVSMRDEGDNLMQ